MPPKTTAPGTVQDAVRTTDPALDEALAEAALEEEEGSAALPVEGLPSQDAEAAVEDAAENRASFSVVSGGRLGNYVGGLPDENTICELGGLTDRSKLRKHPEFARALDAIAAYQNLCTAQHTLDDFLMPALGDQTYAALSEVVNAIEGAARRYRRWFASRSTTMTGLMTAFSQVLVKATMLLSRAAALRPEAIVTYAAETGATNVTIGELMDSNVLEQLGSQSVSLTGEESPDKAAAAYRAHKEGKTRGEAYNAARGADREALLRRTIPPYGSPYAEAEIASLLSALDNATFVAETGSHGDDIANARMPFFGLNVILSMYSDPEIGPAWAEIEGKTVAEAAAICQEALFDETQTLGAGFDPAKHQTGGAASKVLLDFDNDRILRTSAKGVTDSTPDQMREDIEKSARNSYFDEALSVLDKLFGSHVIAEASVAKYTDAAGKTHFGSQMALAKGKEASKFNFGLGSEAEFADVLLRTRDEKRDRQTGEVISATDRPYYNLMDNPAMLGEMLKLQVIDYVAASADRHANNFFLNPNAAPGQALVTGIDNDRAFREAGINNVSGFAHTRGAEQDNSADMRMGAYNSVTIGHAFRVITPEVRDMINSVTPDRLRTTLRPYLSRPALAITVERLRTLQDYIKGSEVVDLGTEDGRARYAAFLKEVMFDTVTHFMRFQSPTQQAGGYSVAERSGNLAANVLMDSFVDTYFVGQGGSNFNLDTILRALGKMGYTRTQVLTALRDNGRLKPGGKPLTEDEFQQYLNSPLFAVLPL